MWAIRVGIAPIGCSDSWLFPILTNSLSKEYQLALPFDTQFIHLIFFDTFATSLLGINPD